MIQWRKSSRSQGAVNTDCVEISTNTSEATLIRDSKNQAGPRLVLTRGEFTDLLNKIKGLS
jgi:hypothetical protein